MVQSYWIVYFEKFFFHLRGLKWWKTNIVIHKICNNEWHNIAIHKILSVIYNFSKWSDILTIFQHLLEDF